MNNKKDTQRTSINIYGQSDVSDIKSLSDKSIYDFANKKTEKLVTALYMVTDCMDTDDALKGKLRLLGVDLLSDMYRLRTLSPMDKHVHISASITHIFEILSFIEIANTIGFISDMNTLILKNEFEGLLNKLKSYQSKDQHFTFTLNEKMFDTPEEDFEDNKHFLKDKRTRVNSMSFMTSKSPIEKFGVVKRTSGQATTFNEREDRSERIIALVKEKKEISIKDISLSFTDCSEKTIQRDLNALVLKGLLKKTGSKRWSRYSVIDKEETRVEQ